MRLPILTLDAPSRTPHSAPMPARETTLEVASFLESPVCQSMPEGARAAAGKILERFLGCCFDELGKAPRTLDGEDLHGILGHLLPGQFGKKDPIAEHVGEVLRAYLRFLEGRAILSQAYELGQALEANLPHFYEAVRSGKPHAHGHAHGAPQQPIVNRAEKVGRNDPCPCGSGKKFKQCCAKIG